MISIIIPAKNEHRNISRCIESIVSSINGKIKYEIIVVDNGSVDGTPSIAKNLGARTYIVNDKNVSGLRNFGVEKSNYEYLAFLDADCEVLVGWPSEGIRLLENDRFGIVGGYALVPKDSSSWVEKIMYQKKEITLTNPSYLGSCNMILRKKTFNKVGGFNESAVSGEDYILCQNIKELGLEVLSSPNLAVYHYGYPKTLKALFKREVWHGLGMFPLLKSGKLTMPLIWSCLNLLLLLSMFFLVFWGCYAAFFLLLVVLFLLPAGAALLRMYRMGEWGNPIKMYIILTAYGFARTLSVIKFIVNIKPRLAI